MGKEGPGSTPHSPALSTKTARTQMDAGGGTGMSHAPSLHSLGVLGLRPVPPPVPSHASAAAPTQPPSLGMRDVEESKKKRKKVRKLTLKERKKERRKNIYLSSLGVYKNLAWQKQYVISR
jgi:hypothetical protein